MGRLGPSCDGDLAQEDKAFDVVDEISHSDLGGCSGDPDCSDEQPHPILFLGEYMLDTRGIKQSGKHAISILLQHVL
jgi:hypothetical protein